MTNEQLEATLAQLVAIPSVTRDRDACKEVLDFAANQLSTADISITRSANSGSPWLLGTTKQTNTPDILLIAHLDVVPGSEKMFKVQKESGKLFGRGVYDMKLAAACYIELFKEHSAILKEKNIGILFTTDEETGGESFPGILKAGLRPKIAFIPDGGDNWHIEKRAKGFYDVAITVHGKSAHGSRPWEGDNAIHSLNEIIRLLRDAFPFKSTADTTLEVTQINGGQAINQIPEHATALIDFRTFDPNEIERYKKLLGDVSDNYDVDIDLKFAGDPLRLDEKHPMVKDFLSTLQAFTGQSPAFSESFGGSDGRFFVPYTIPVIIMEPIGGGRHTEEEWLDADDLLRYYQFLEHWLIAAKNTDN